MAINGYKTTMRKVPYIGECKTCDYTSSYKKDFDKHLLTAKHKNRTNAIKLGQIENTVLSYDCSCGKKYKHSPSLHKHQKNCRTFPQSQPQFQNNEIIDPNIIYEIIKQNRHLILENKEMKDMLIEQQKNMIEEQQKTINELVPKVGNNNNNTTNLNNSNVIVLLNEKCKDAMNMSDFLKSAKFTIENLDTTKDNGLANGITQAFVEKIKKLDIHKRPIHCSDLKREILYIKDNDLWEKDKDHDKIKHVINRLAFIQRQSLDTWTDENPDFMNSSASSNDEYIKLLNKSMQCLKENKEEDKVIKNICKDVQLSKEEL